MARRLSLLWMTAIVLACPRAFAAEDTDWRATEAEKSCSAGKADEGTALLAQLYAETKDAKWIYSQAICWEQNSRPEEATSSFRKYLRAAKGLSPKAKADVQRHIRQCRAKPAQQKKSGESVAAPTPEATTTASTAAAASEAESPNPASDTPSDTPSAPTIKPALVTIHSALPGVEIRVDDEPAGKTPIAEPLSVSPGKHGFELARTGYMTMHRTLELRNGGYGSLFYDPDEDPSAETPRGRLKLDAHGAEITVTIDGRRRGIYRQPIVLPFGAHALKLERPGYEPLEKTVEISGGEETAVNAWLRPTAEAKVTEEDHARHYRRWAVAALVSGALFAGGFTTLAIWSNGKLPEANDNLTAVRKAASGGGSCDPSGGLSDIQRRVCDERLSKAQDDVDRYRNLRLGGYIGAGVGAALVITGITLLIVGPERSPSDSQETVAGSLKPVLAAGPDGIGLWMHGRF